MNNQRKEILFKSDAHKERFIAMMQAIGKVHDGEYDPEYGAALYILSADLATWQKIDGSITSHGIDFAGMLRNVDFGGGHTVLVKLAGNLFNGEQHIDPLEFLRLDDVKNPIPFKGMGLCEQAWLD